MVRSAVSAFLKFAAIWALINMTNFQDFLERPALPRYTTTWSVDTVTMFSHVHNALVQRTRCTGRCPMQIRNPVVCDRGKSSLYK